MAIIYSFEEYRRRQGAGNTSAEAGQGEGDPDFIKALQREGWILVGYYSYEIQVRGETRISWKAYYLPETGPRWVYRFCLTQLLYNCDFPEYTDGKLSRKAAIQEIKRGFLFNNGTTIDRVILRPDLLEPDRRRQRQPKAATP